MRQSGSDTLTDALRVKGGNNNISIRWLTKKGEWRSDCVQPQVYIPHIRRLPLSFALIFGVVVGQAVQDEDLPPLCALVEGRQQLVDVLGIEVQQVAVGVRLADLRQRSHCVGHNLEDGGVL